jgi:hypothetical protein
MCGVSRNRVAMEKLLVYFWKLYAGQAPKKGLFKDLTNGDNVRTL